MYILIHLRRVVQKKHVEWFTLIIIPILYFLIIIIKFTLPLLLGYPVCWVHKLLWICVLLSLRFFHVFERVWTALFVGICGLLYQLIFCFHATRRILGWSNLKIYALYPWHGWGDGRFLLLPHQWFPGLLGSDLCFNFLFLFHYCLWVPWGILGKYWQWHLKIIVSLRPPRSLLITALRKNFSMMFICLQLVFKFALNYFLNYIFHFNMVIADHRKVIPWLPMGNSLNYHTTILHQTLRSGYYF